MPNKKDKKKPLSKEDEKLFKQLYDKHSPQLKGWLRKNLSTKLSGFNLDDDVEAALQDIFLEFGNKVKAGEYQLVARSAKKNDSDNAEQDYIFCTFPNDESCPAFHCLARIYTIVLMRYLYKRKNPKPEPIDASIETNLPSPKGEDDVPKKSKKPKMRAKIMIESSFPLRKGEDNVQRNDGPHQLLESHPDITKRQLEDRIAQQNEQDTIDTMNYYVELLDNISNELISLRYIDGMKLKAIADKHGERLNARSRATVSRRLSDIIESLKSYIIKELNNGSN